MDLYLPKPVLFNYWKHHQGFLVDYIRSVDTKSDIKLHLKKIGSSTTDLYTGDLSIMEIVQITCGQINERNIADELSYIEWIHHSHEDYRSLPFPDKSIWIYKIGIEEGRFVHIHPGRNVPHTMRIKANVLKTAVVSSILAIKENSDPLDISTINHARTSYINLDPIKFVTLNQELGRVIYQFACKLGIKN